MYCVNETILDPAMGLSTKNHYFALENQARYWFNERKEQVINDNFSKDDHTEEEWNLMMSKFNKGEDCFKLFDGEFTHILKLELCEPQKPSLQERFDQLCDERITTATRIIDFCRENLPSDGTPLNLLDEDFDEGDGLYFRDIYDCKVDEFKADKVRINNERIQFHIVEENGEQCDQWSNYDWYTDCIEILMHIDWSEK